MINFHVLVDDFLPKKETEIKNWLREIVESKGKDVDIINVIFCDDEYLLKLNQKHLKHDYYTDIITFNYSENEIIVSGDLYISIDRVKENAMIYKVSLEMELNRVMAHGLLHLLGYNDETESEKEEMNKRENACLDLLK